MQCADLKEYIGLPSKKAIYAILVSAVEELNRRKLISLVGALIDWRAIEFFPKESKSLSNDLYELAKLCEGFSGRVIRRLPFLAFTKLKQQVTASIPHFLEALKGAILDEIASRERLGLKN
ncbi:Pachytene checkpoint protein 2 [Phlyctochytrium bullatum]|nr:Pachytene checkpoint protein 2 [Phlyctochytrium bullatum]